MGVYEDMIARLFTPGPSAGFPAAVTAAPARDPWDLPRLSDLPQTLLPPHLRTNAGTVDASAPAIQSAIGNAPAGPAIPEAFRNAGMLPSLDPNVPVGMTEAEREMQALGGAPRTASPVPLPMARPNIPVADDGGLPAPPSMGGGPVTDMGARSRRTSPGGPIQIAPALPAAAVAPAGEAGMMSGLPDILSRIRTTLGDNSNTLLALGAGFAGAPNIGQGISRAAAAAIPARAADYKQSIDRTARTYGTQALIEAGVPRQLAIAASGDPELKKALIKNYIEDRAGKIVELGMDRDGRKVMGTFDPYTKKIEPINIDKLNGQDAAATSETDVTGPDYLERLKLEDPAYARQVEAIINGDAPIPTGKTALTPRGARLVKDVLTVEPGVSASDFTNRQAVKKDYSSGVSSRVNKAVNTAITHGAGLEKAIADLKNFSVMPGVLNPVTGLIQKQYDKEYQKARKEFEVNAENYVRELDFAISGGRPTVSGAAHQRSAFDINASPEENMASLRKSIDLLKGRLDSQAEGYNKGMRTNREGVEFIDPANVEAYRRLLGETGGHGGKPAAASAAPAVPKVPVGKSVVIQTPNGPVTIRKVAE